MKALHIFAVIFSMVFSSFCGAEQENSALPVTPIKELKIEEIDFDNLPKKSQVGNLLEVVKDASLLENLTDRIRNQVTLQPYSEGLAYVNGQLCHVGNYSQSIIYTVLEGPNYGTQTTTAYNGVVLYVNYDYKIKYTASGVILQHRYSDSKVITGANQVIIFN